MAIYSNTIIIIIGIYAMMILLHLLMLFNKKNVKNNIPFLFVTLFSLGYSVTLRLLMLTSNLEKYLYIWKFQIFFIAGAIISLLWFGTAYANYKRMRTKLVLTIVWMIIPFIRISDKWVLFFSEFYGIKSLQLPWNEVLYHATGKVSNFVYFFYFLILFTITYVLYTVIRYSTEKYKKKLFIIITIIYFITFIHDMVIYIFNIPWLQLAPFATLSMLMIISISVINALIETQKLQKKLKVEKNRNELALYGTGAGLWDLDLTKNIIEINELWAEMLGYSKSELIPLTYEKLIDLIHPEDQDRVRLKFNNYLTGKIKTYSIEYRLRQKNNQWVWILASGKGVAFNNQGIPTRMTGTIVKINRFKQSERALKREKELLYAIKENIPVGIVLWSKEGELISTNQEFHAITELDREEIGTLNEWSAKLNLTAIHYQHHNKQNQLILTKNNQLKEIQLRTDIIPDGRILFSLVDITEKAKKEREIRETQELLNSALTQAPIGIIIVDAPEGNIRAMNDVARTIRGLDDQGIRELKLSGLGRFWTAYRSDGSLYPQEKQPLARAINHGEFTDSEEILMINNDTHEELWLQVSAAPIFNSEKHVISSIVLFNDITKQKISEKNLSKAKNYIDNIINSMPSALIGVDDRLTITHWNKQASKRTGINWQQAINHNIDKMIPDINNLKSVIQKSIKLKQVQKIAKVKRKSDYHEIIEDVIIFPLVSDHVYGAVIRIDNITDTVNLEELMIQSEKMMSIGGIAAGMAHEINNPLAGMMQNAAVLYNRLSKDSPKNLQIAKEIGIDFNGIIKFMENRNIIKQLELIKKSGERASNLVQNMLSFARKTSSKFQYSHINEIMDKTLQLVTNDYNMKKKYDFKKIRIIKEYEDNLTKIKCEKTKLQQVFINILKNGAEAMVSAETTQEPPCFILRIFQFDNTITIEIENNGPAIPAEIKKRIFEPFYTTKEIGKGTGLGLSVSYFIVTQNHNGKMWVTNSDIGPKFVIQLPIGKTQ